MAEGLSEPVRASDEHAAEAPLAPPMGVPHARQKQRLDSPHSAKFKVATAMLIGIAVGAIAVAIVVLLGGDHAGPAGRWSAWSPPDSGSQGARQIADHLAPLYRIDGTNQLAVVTVVNLGNQATAQPSASSSASSSQSGPQVAVRPNQSSSALSLLSGHTIAYNLCGVGSSNCTIGVGTPSSDRLLLLRREALELALYTFKYIDGAQNVVAILPPGHTTQGCTGICPTPKAKTTTKQLDIAVLFVRDELKPWLSQPLSNTLPEQFPPMASELSVWRQTPEAAIISQITSRGLFSEQLVQAQDGSNLIVLNPLPPQ